MINVGNMMLCLFSQLQLTGKIPCSIFCDKGQKTLRNYLPKTKSESICGTKASCKVNKESGNYIAALLLYCSSPQAKKTSPHNMLIGWHSDKKSFSETWDKCMHSILFRKPVTKFQVIEGTLLTFWKEVKILLLIPWFMVLGTGS